MDISINVAGIGFVNPIILASGPLSDSRAGLLRAEKMGVGGVITKSATLTPSEGNPHPRLAFGKDYIIVADGLRNKGYKAMANDIKDAKQNGMSIPVIASVAGASLEEFAEMSAEFELKGADAIELNLACPNRGSMVGEPKDETMGRYWSETPERSFRVVRAVKDVVSIPVWAKFPFEIVYRDLKIIQRMEEAGVDAAVVTVSIPNAMAINLETGKPVLGNPRGTGTLGGRMMKSLGIKCISELSRIIVTPVIATGGVFSGLDVLEYTMVGAHGVEVLTAVMQKVAVLDMLAEIQDFMSHNGYDNFQALRGKTLEFLPRVSMNT